MCLLYVALHKLWDASFKDYNALITLCKVPLYKALRAIRSNYISVYYMKRCKCKNIACFHDARNNNLIKDGTKNMQAPTA